MTDIRTEMNTVQPAVLLSLAATATPLVRAVEIDERAVTGLDEVREFHKPTDILLSRWYPGYRVTSLVGKDAEETVAVLLAKAFQAPGALAEFRGMLSSPVIPRTVVATLFPRASDPIKTRKMLLSEDAVRQAVASAVPSSDPLLILAYTHVFLACLAHPSLDVVMMGEEKRVLAVASSLVVTADDLRRALLIDALRGVFSDARVSAAMRAVTEACTPAVLTDVLIRMFRDLSRIIPEIVHRLEQLDVAMALVRDYLRAPERLVSSVRVLPALAALASYANFVVAAVDQNQFKAVEGPNSLAGSVAEQKAACEAVLAIVQSAPSMESVSLDSFAEYYGVAPISSTDGIKRGAVLYGYGGQTSKMDVYDRVETQPGLTRMSALPSEYARPVVLATAVTNALSTVGAHTSIAHLIADELATSEWAGPSVNPWLVTYNVEALPLVFLAMARASVVALTGPEAGGAVRLVFACPTTDQWGLRPLGATPQDSFFATPEALILYSMTGQATEPRPLPSRAQSIPAEVARDVTYVGEIDEFLSTEVTQAFKLKVPVSTGPSGVTSLELQIDVLSPLLTRGLKPEDVGYVTVREPGVDEEFQRMFEVALAYAGGAQELLADRAKSWLVEQLAPIVVHPETQRLAQRALNAAIYEQKLDVRAFRPAYRDMYLRACFGAALAVLSRFNKLDKRHVRRLIELVPISGLTIKAQLAMASMPAAGRLAADS